MNINHIDQMVRGRKVKVGERKWSESLRVKRESVADQQCYYCNFSLECGEQLCIWRDDIA